MLRFSRSSYHRSPLKRRLAALAFTGGTLGLVLGVGSSYASSPENTDAIEAGDKKKEDRFNLKVEVGEAKAGQKATAKVTLKPIDPWHVNMEFPTSLKLTAPADIKLAKDKLKKGDAKAMSEHGGAVFEVEFTPSKKGEAKIDGKLKFAICIESSCSPVTQMVEIKTKVK